MTNAELLIEKDKQRKSKLFHAVWIGFLAGIVIFGCVAWLLSAEKRFGFLIPMFFPVYFIYRMVKTSKKRNDLEEVLKERGLN